jgi:DNA-binding CsgD family transcriptional regulator
MTDYRIIAALLLQLAALVLFLYDFAGTFFALPVFHMSWELHEIIELLAIIGLLVGSAMTLSVLRASLKRTARVEEQLQIAAKSFHSVLLSRFVEWGLTPAERETAMLIVKGFSIAEIAEIRGKSEGTIKAQNSAIYRKSGLAGRVQFVSHFIEELTAEF